MSIHKEIKGTHLCSTPIRTGLCMGEVRHDASKCQRWIGSNRLQDASGIVRRATTTREAGVYFQVNGQSHTMLVCKHNEFRNMMNVMDHQMQATRDQHGMNGAAAFDP